MQIIRCSILVALALTLSVAVHGAVTIKIKAGNLKDASGAPFPVSGLVLVVASPDDNQFVGPDSDGFINGDDVILGTPFDLSSTDTAGLFIETISNIPLQGNLGAGDPISIYWFPTLGKGAAKPDVGDPYGHFTSSGPSTGGAPWVIPPDGGSITLELITTDADFNVLKYTDQSHAQSPATGLASSSIPDDSSGGVVTPPPVVIVELIEGDSVLESEGDWYQSNWFGEYSVIGNRWYFHDELGFVFAPQDLADGGIWFWSPALDDWLWTKDGIWPYAFTLESSWIYFEKRGSQMWRYRIDGQNKGWVN